jgi:DNA-binding MarR family transcriptional regulator
MPINTINDVWLDEKFCLWTLIHQASSAAMAAREKELEKLGLTSVEQRLLIIVPTIERMTGEGATIGDIARWTFKKPSSITELVNRMEKKGLVRRMAADGNKKSVIVKTTESGEKLAAEAHSKGHLIDKLMSSLSDEERHQMWISMGRLRNSALKELGMTKKPPYPQFL